MHPDPQSVTEPPDGRVRVLEHAGFRPDTIIRHTDDRDQTESSGKQAHEEDEVPAREHIPGAMKKTDLPPDTDYDVILELDPVEEMRDDTGAVIKAWRCESCDLRFQYYTSFDKHNQREHPNYKPSKKWVILDDDSGDDRVVDDAYLVNSDDSEFSPNYYKKKKRKKVRGQSTDRFPANRDLSDGQRRKPGRPPGRPAAPAIKQEPKSCSACHVQFANQKLVDSHYRRNHFIPYNCTMCKKKFETFRKLYVHCENIHDAAVEDLLHATLSDAGDSDPEDRRIQLAGRAEPVLFPCNMCPNLYPTEIVLSGHKLRQHADEIPDLAVIESMKRLWRSRYDPAHIKLHESALEQLGPIEEERVAAGLPAVPPKKRRSYVKKLTAEEKKRRNEERRRRKEAGITSDFFGRRDENGKFRGYYRTEEQKELAKIESNRRRNEKRRLLYDAQKEAKEKGLPIPKTLKEAGIEVPWSHVYKVVSQGTEPSNMEQLILEEGAASMNIEPVEEGQARPKRKSQMKAIESIKEYAKKLGIVKVEPDAEGGDQVEGANVFDDDTDFMATENEGEDSSEDSGEDRAKFPRRSPKKRNADDPQASNSGGQENGDGPRKKKRRNPANPGRKGDESRICPFTGRILSGTSRSQKPKNWDTSDGSFTPMSKFDFKFQDTCRKCNQEFFTDKEVVKHIGKVHFDPENPRRSVYKDADPAGYEALIRRAKTAFKCKEEDCPVSYYRYAYVEELAEHMHREHQKKMFDSDGKEVATVIPEKELALKPQNRYKICQVCEQIVRGERMDQHNWYMHTPEGLPLTFPCDFPDCEFACRFAHKLVWHRRSVHMDMKNIACTYCDKKFGTPYQLRKHVRIHEGYRYQCRHCTESFKSAQGKINHELHQHSGKGPEFECQECGKRFWYARDVRKHQRQKHGEDQHPLPLNKNAENASMRRKGNKNIAVMGEEGDSQVTTMDDLVPVGASVDPPKKKRSPRKPAAPKDPNAPKRSRSKKKAVVDPNEGNRAVESLDLEGLHDSTMGSDVEVHPDLYRAVHDQLTNETVYVLQDAYNATNAQVYHQPLHNQNQSQHHSMTTRSQQYQQHQPMHQPQPQPIVVVQPQQHHAHHSQHQQHHHQQQLHQPHLHQMQPSANYGLYLQPAPVTVMAVEGDCKLCGIRDRDIRLHYIGFHKIPEDKAHFFMAM